MIMMSVRLSRDILARMELLILHALPFDGRMWGEAIDRSKLQRQARAVCRRLPKRSRARVTSPMLAPMIEPMITSVG